MRTSDHILVFEVLQNAAAAAVFHIAGVHNKPTMQFSTDRLGNFDCDFCADKGFGFERQPTTWRLYKFPSTIGAEGPAPILFVGINPRKSGSNINLHKLITSDLNAFDQLSRNTWCGEAYIATDGREKHYRKHAEIAKAASKGNETDCIPFESVAACTELFLCATKDSTTIKKGLGKGRSPCVERHFWTTLNRVKPKVVIAVGAHVFDFLKSYIIGVPPRLNIADKPALLAIPHPGDHSAPLSLETCGEVGRICSAIISSGADAISYEWDYRRAPPIRMTATGDMIERRIDGSARYGWRPHHRAANLHWLEENSARKIRYRLIKDRKCRYNLELDARQLRQAIGKYVDGPNWGRTGYVNPITISVGGGMTEQLKRAWVCFASPCDSDVPGD